MKSLIRRFVRHWPAAFSLLATLLFVSTAYAYGRVEWTSTHLKEKKLGTQSKWKVEIKIFLPKPPDIAHVPVKFEFKPVVFYERFMSDDSPNVQTRKVPTPNAQDIIESVELGFLDPGSGKIENRTRFAFEITRAHGFEAGEYRVTIKNSDTGAVIGTPTTLYLEGENEVIDRRAMVFSGGDKDKDKDKEKAEKAEGEEEAEDSESAADDDDSGAGEGSMDWQEAEREKPLPPPEPLQKKGACACRAAGEASTAGGALLPLLLGLAFVARRRWHRA